MVKRIKFEEAVEIVEKYNFDLYELVTELRKKDSVMHQNERHAVFICRYPPAIFAAAVEAEGEQLERFNFTF
jgi:hypothetical protein